jgi:hypothetical protein
VPADRRAGYWHLRANGARREREVTKLLGGQQVPLSGPAGG